MLHDLPGFVESENVDAGPFLVFVCRPGLFAVQDDDKASLRDRALELDVLPRVLPGHALEVESFESRLSPTAAINVFNVAS